MNNPVKRARGAVIVTRVSTGDQDKNGTSPETQLAMCRAKAAQLNLPIIAEYYDAGISGAFLLSRAGMQRAISDIREGRADTMICPTISRYSRDRGHQEAIKKAVHNAGGRLVFCDMEYSDTAAGNLQFNIAGDFAVYERDLFRERSMLGKRNRAENGVQPTRSLAPFGYHIPTKADVMHGLYGVELLGRYVIVEEEAAVVRRIFAGYAAGTHSMHRLCKELNSEGVPTAKGADAWRPPSIKAILANPVHKGEPQYGKVRHRKTEERLADTNPLTGRPYRTPTSRQKADPDEMVTLSAPAIVSLETWERAQERSARNKARMGGQPARVQMLTGFATCPTCGGGMRYLVVRQGERSYRYFQCHRHIQCKAAGIPSTCEQTSYLVDEAEQAVEVSLAEAVDRPDWVAAQVAVYGRGSGQDREEVRREAASLERALSGLAAEEGAAVQAQIRGIMSGASPGAYDEVFAQIALRRREMEDRRDSLKRVLNSRPSAGKAVGEEAVRRQALADLRRVLTSEAVSALEKRNMIGTVIERVICRKGGAEVVYLPGLFSDMFGDTVQGVSTPQPKKAIVRPWASKAPRWAEVSTPRAPPETTVNPWAASSWAKRLARESPYWVARREPTMATLNLSSGTSVPRTSKTGGASGSCRRLLG